MNKSKMKGIGSIVAKAATIIGLAGGASLASDMFLFGGKFSNNKDDEQTEKATETSETTEETEKVPAEDVTVEDTKDKDKEDE